ncbi:MAG: hypothetical protein IPJ49_29260 [Candidatus Obscuribacter sp.]|nr:hypothetical protein [Candidatus Obscuribacter sp.]
MDRRLFGLDLTMNSKVGFAFSLPRNKTCIDATEVCKKLCYGRGIRYQSVAQKEKRERNFRTIEYLLEMGGPELLAENLVLLIDHARPLDWLSAKLTGQKGSMPWTLRIHDVGDFHSSAYVRSWAIAARLRPDCAFWFYSRSFVTPEVFEALCELASLANCQGWLSADRENYRRQLVPTSRFLVGRFHSYKTVITGWQRGFWGRLRRVLGGADLVCFPYHHGGRHVEPLNEPGILVCPQVMGTFALESNAHAAKPCQQCQFCLPA